jgi:beta-glucosidase
VELPSTDCYGDALAAAVTQGEVRMETLDRAVRRVLELKVDLGLFEDPFVDEREALAVMDTAEHRSLAADVARKSLVLLRNEGVLPLGPTPGKIAVIGPNADTARNMFGDYSHPAHMESLVEMRDRHNVFLVPVPDDVSFAVADLEFPTILDSLRHRYGDAVGFAPGCAVNDGDTSGFEEAVALAGRSDVVVLVLGDKAGLTAECTSGEGRDRSSLDLPGVQEDLARAVLDTGTPVVTVLVVGRPCGSEYLHERSAAVLLAWLPGQEGAQAVGEALSGELNPGGKLPITFPRNVGQIPIYYGHKISGGRSHWQGDYVDGPTTPLYPFGFGLSYTEFRLDHAEVETPSVGEDGVVRASVSLENVGDVVGDEVVQLYIRDGEASVTRPVLELKNFVRVTVEPGDSKTVQFEVPIGQLGFYDADLDYVVEDGEIEILIGTSSDHLMAAGQVSVKAVGPIAKAFDGSRTVE